MCGKWVVSALIFLLLLFSGVSSVSATPPAIHLRTFAGVVTGLVSNVLSALVKWLWSLQSNSKIRKAVSSRSMMKFESGYTVETVFDGSRLGIEPYSVEASPSGELLVLDSENSNIYKISTPLSTYSRPKLIVGSPEGYSGHVDGKLREARMNHPKGLTMDDRGNLYIADTMNMAIRKISDGGVTTIAGGKRARGVGHVDGPSEDAKFSDDFDLVYVGSSCSLLVIDRGNLAIREIQLHDDDCNYQYNGNFHLGVAVLVAAGFFGYMLALLQRRVQALFSSNDDLRTHIKKDRPMPPYQRPPTSGRAPLFQNEDEPKEPGEGFFGSLGRLVLNTGSIAGAILRGLFSGSRRKPHQYHYGFQHQYQQPRNRTSTSSMQESYVIPDEDEPPPLEARVPTPKKTYPFMTKDMEKNHHIKQNRGGYHSGWDDDYYQQQQQQQHHRHYTTNPKTCHEKSCETNEIVFGAVQEHDGRREAVMIRAVDYGDPRYNHYNLRPRYNYVDYPPAH